MNVFGIWKLTKEEQDKVANSYTAKELQEQKNQQLSAMLQTAHGNQGAFGSAMGILGSTPPPMPPWPQSTSTQAQAENVAKKSRYSRCTITLEETSNGTIITIGEIKRVCPNDKNLFDEVAAAYTEAKIS